MLDADEVALLERAALNVGGDGTVVNMVVNACAYSCCGRGWQRRDGYEQAYTGWVDSLTLPEGEAQGTFMLYSAGLGTIGYVVAVRFSEVELLEVAPGAPPVDAARMRASGARARG